MKKTFIAFGLLLTIILSSVSVLASDFSIKDDMNTQPEVKRIVTVGYYIEDKKEIFGDISDEEIREILHEKAKELIEFENLGYRSIENNYLKSLDSKLIISILDKEKGFEFNHLGKFNNLDKPNDVDEIKPFGPDERLVKAATEYTVAFDVTGFGTLYGDYVSYAEGVVNDGRYGIIQKLVTGHLGRAKFPVSDYTYGTDEAHNIFYSIDSEYIRLGRGDFSITKWGVIKFHGVR